MKKIIILFFILVLHNSINSQWVQQTSGTDENIFDVHIASLSNIYAMGNNTFLKSTNGGNSWQQIISFPSINLRAMHFINSSTGYLGGGNGQMVKTTTGGTSWAFITNPSPQPVISIHFVSGTTGFAGTSVGDIFKTTNGGANWIALGTGVDAAINRIFFISPNTGWFVSGSQGNLYGNIIKKTINGGASWVTQHSILNFPFTSVFMVDASTGFVTQAGEILKTTNGGTNWFGIGAGNGAYMDIFMANESTGYACGVNGLLKKTTNGGYTWGTQSSGTTETLHRIKSNILFTTLAYAVGQNGTILRTTNGGGNFIDPPRPVSNEAPAEFSLGQNYPNPFNPQTTISFAIPEQSRVQLKVYDMLGKEVAVLMNERLNGGNYSVEFNAAKLPSGTYFYRLTAGEFTETKKLILIK